MKNVYLLFRAYSLIVVSLLIILVVVMIANLNPKVSSEKTAEVRSPGELAVHVIWPNGDIDVDLWVTGPDEPAPVGYSNKGGLLWNLLRDDLGNIPDALPVNFEDAFTRGLVPGEYVINVQCFRCDEATFPMNVDVAVSLRTPGTGSSGFSNFVITKVIFKADGQEKTAVRFTIKDDKTVDMTTINNVYKKLRGPAPPKDLHNGPSYYDGGRQ